MSVQKYLTLPGKDEYKMPILGLGTLKNSSSTNDMKIAIEAAFDNGYRLIDTAYVYYNESQIGDALKEIFDSGKIKREEVFITTKLASMYTGSRENIRTCLSKSLSALKLDYIDLYLIHWPTGNKLTETEDFVPKEGEPFERHDHVEVWKALEELVDEGKIRSIGLSNFNSKQISKIHSIARIPISNLQVECHIYLPQIKLLQFCQRLGITMTSYCTLGSHEFVSSLNDGPEIPPVLSHTLVNEIAKHHNKTPAQVLLRMMVQRGIAIIPKSSNLSRIQENSKIFDFELSSQEMEKLLLLNRNVRYFEQRKLFGDHPDFPFNEEF